MIEEYWHPLAAPHEVIMSVGDVRRILKALPTRFVDLPENYTLSDERLFEYGEAECYREALWSLSAETPMSRGDDARVTVRLTMGQALVLDKAARALGVEVPEGVRGSVFDIGLALLKMFDRVRLSYWRTGTPRQREQVLEVMRHELKAYAAQEPTDETSFYVSEAGRLFRVDFQAYYNEYLGDLSQVAFVYEEKAGNFMYVLHVDGVRADFTSEGAAAVVLDYLAIEKHPRAPAEPEARAAPEEFRCRTD